MKYAEHMHAAATEYLSAQLAKHGGSVRSMALAIGIKRGEAYNKLRQLGISVARRKRSPEPWQVLRARLAGDDGLHAHMRKVALEYLRELLAKHDGSVRLVALEAGIRRGDAYKKLRQHGMGKGKPSKDCNEAWQELRARHRRAGSSLGVLGHVDRASNVGRE